MVVESQPIKNKSEVNRNKLKISGTTAELYI